MSLQRRETSLHFKVVIRVNEIDALREQIAQTEKILIESRDNYQKNPDEYSAQLLLLTTENHLSDLLKKLDALSQASSTD